MRTTTLNKAFFLLIVIGSTILCPQFGWSSTKNGKPACRNEFSVVPSESPLPPALSDGPGSLDTHNSTVQFPGGRLQISTNQRHVIVEWPDPLRRVEFWSFGRVQMERAGPGYRKIIFLDPKLAKQSLSRFIASVKSGVPVQLALNENWLMVELLSHYRPVWSLGQEPRLARSVFEASQRTNFGFEHIVFESRGTVLRVRFFGPEPNAIDGPLQSIFVNDRGDIQINNYQKSFTSAITIESQKTRRLILQMVQLATRYQSYKISSRLIDFINKNAPEMLESTRVVPDWNLWLKPPSP